MRLKQHALWELEGMPILHRTDRPSAAVNKPIERHEFMDRYQALTRHDGLGLGDGEDATAFCEEQDR